jgi:hypothetical protein
VSAVLHNSECDNQHPEKSANLLEELNSPVPMFPKEFKFPKESKD